jgi:hypothetical protein
MSHFIQTLESRTLFAATLAEDQLIILADAVAARASLKVAASTMSADVKAIAADLRPLTTASNRAANAGLLKALKADVAVTLATLRADGKALLAKSTAMARRVAAVGKALQLRPGTPALQARLAADLPALQAAITAAMANIQTHLNAIDLATELNAIVNANPSGTALAAHAQAAESNVSTVIGSFAAAVNEFQTDVGTLITNASSLPTGPYLVGNYTGAATATTGPEAGVKFALTVEFTSQGADGALAGTVTVKAPNEPAMSMTLVGSVSEDGTFTATLTGDTPDEGVTLTGQVTGSIISGTYVGTGDTGTFTLKR